MPFAPQPLQRLNPRFIPNTIKFMQRSRTLPSLHAPRASLVLAALLSAGGLVHAQSVNEDRFGSLPDGTEVTVYTLENASGMVAKVLNLGGVMTELHAPDRNGEMGDVLLGYEDVDSYLHATYYFGALIGQYGNRIGGAAFELDGDTYELPQNDGDNTLHGGEKGFDKVIWDAAPVEGEAALKLTYRSEHLEQGFPGNVDVTVIYSLTDENELKIEYEATTDRPTVVNLTQHNYYNLRGHGHGSILDHELTLFADHFTPVSDSLIPTGEMEPVEGTPMDFRQPRPIGSRIDADFEQLEYGAGYDHNWALNKDRAGELTQAARLYDPDSGREMEVWTTEPGIQFYSGNFLDSQFPGKDGAVYHFRYGLCLETQHFPDSPNQEDFPSTRLNPGETYRSTTIYRFSTQ